MQKISTPFSQELYKEHLSTINSIPFTNREIDVISCLLDTRRTKKIALLLFLKPRAVDSHIRNIMSKIKCNTREDIIDFIKIFEKIFFLKKYYALIKNELLFEKSLREIARLNNEKASCCILMGEKDRNSLFLQLKSHLELTGIKSSIRLREKKSDYTIFVLPSSLSEEAVSAVLPKIQQSLNKVILLLQKGKDYQKIPQELIKWDIIDFTLQENYFSSFFILLKQFFPHNFDAIIADFESNYKISHTAGELGSSDDSKKQTGKNFAHKKWGNFFFTCCLMGILGGGGLIFYRNKNNDDTFTIRSDLVIPKKAAFLDRGELIAQINKLFNKNEKIKSIAIIGIGGSGKTTLARQYAQQQKAKIVWEVNAETKSSLMESFKKLAYSLAATKNDKETLQELLEISNLLDQEQKLIEFVKIQLKSHSEWFLIYDNVEKFADIKKYFPQDSDTWGQGKIIITTRNHNIAHNKYVGEAMSIGELSAAQKLHLFVKIILNSEISFFTAEQNIEAQNFLKKIPPFPLDISIAAYYLKATNTPYSTYLEDLSKNNKDFVSVQKNILNEIGDYTQTRHNIISISLEKIINKKQDFRDLLLLISLINSQNIPRELLNNFKCSSIVDNFIFHLKNYSLIADNGLTGTGSKLDLSIHRSTQELILSYLIKKLNLENNKKQIEKASNIIENYLSKVIKEEDLKKMNLFSVHCEFFLNHKNLISRETEGAIKGLLGVVYYFAGDNQRAKIFLEESIEKLDKNYEKNNIRRAYIIGYLGNVFREIGDYNKGVYYLKKCLSIYEKNYPQDALRHGYFLAYLGILERILGKYAIARSLFEQGLALQKSHFVGNENYVAWVSGQIGVLDREAGYYEKAKISLEKSLGLFTKERADDHFDIAWALEHLGPIYTKLGSYSKAKQALEQSIKIYSLSLPDQIGHSWILTHLTNSIEDPKVLFKKVIEKYPTHFHENYLYAAWPLHQLGNLYVNLQNYDKARLILEQCLFIYQKNYGDQHLTSAKILNDLGHIYLLEGNLEEAKDNVEKAFQIFQIQKHPDIYLSLELLSEIFNKNSIVYEKKGKLQQAEDLKRQAKELLNQSLKVVLSTFQKNSPHVVKIRSKLTRLELPPQKYPKLQHDNYLISATKSDR